MSVPTVIWQNSVSSSDKDTEHNFEFEHVNDRIISALPHRQPEMVFDEGRFEFVTDSAVVVVAAGKPQTVARVNAHLERFPAGSGVAVIHLGTEDPTLDVPFYRYADLVLRNYYYPCFDDDPKVFHFPLGYQPGYWSGSTPRPITPSLGFADREFTWSFVGQLKSDRREMIAELTKLRGRRFVHLTSGWMSGDLLSIDKIREVFGRTVVAPCPMGWVRRDARRQVKAELRTGALARRWRTCVDWYPTFWDALHCRLQERFAAVFGA